MTPASYGSEQVEGRTALVTGAGSGLGRHIAGALVDRGARVLLVGRTRATLDATASALPKGSTRVLVADVSDPDQVETLRSAADDENVDILVNNAGVGGPVAGLVDIAPDEFDQVMSANVRSVFLMCRSFVPQMIDRGHGSVLNIASVAAKRPLAGRTPYCASKAAVIALSTTLAAEVGPQGVTVNALSPGPVKSERMKGNFAREAERLGITEQDAESAYVSRAILGRMLEPEEVAAAAIAVVGMSGLHAADIDLSAGMVAR